VEGTETQLCPKPSLFHYTACIQKKKQGFYMVYTQSLQIFYGVSGDVCQLVEGNQTFFDAWLYNVQHAMA